MRRFFRLTLIYFYISVLFRRRFHSFSMPSPSSLSPRERQLRSRLHALLHRAEGFLHGSLIEMSRRCGKTTCRCASSDEHKHQSLYLGQTHEGKTSMVYIPKRLERQIRQWVSDFQEALALLEALNLESRRRLEDGKRPSAKKKAASKSVRKKKPPPKKS